VERETEGHLRIEPGNLYRSLRKMKEEGLIEESDRRPDPAQDDSRRRYFRLTPLGERVLRAEAGRLEHQLEAARVRRLLPLPGGTGETG
jgi:DNA-binding PadR family transcriptional regulator